MMSSCWEKFVIFTLECKIIAIGVRIRVSTGISGYGLRTEMIQKFFPFSLWKKFRTSGIPERIFSPKPEISGTLLRNYRTFKNSGTFQKFPECSRISFRKVSGKIVPKFSGTRYQNYPMLECPCFAELVVLVTLLIKTFKCSNFPGLNTSKV